MKLNVRKFNGRAPDRLWQDHFDKGSFVDKVHVVLYSQSEIQETLQGRLSSPDYNAIEEAVLGQK